MPTARAPCALILAAAALVAGCAARPAEQPAAAEASGQEQAVKLTLRLHKTRVRVGDPLRVQFVLTNAGFELIPVLDDLYRHPEALDYNQDDRRRTFLEVRGPDGAALESWRVLHLSLYNEEHLCGGPPRGPSYNPREPGKDPTIRLKPGESIATRTWSVRSPCTGEPRFEEVPPFITADDLRPVKPGRHKLRAVYSWGPESGEAVPASRRHYEVVARTEWIEFDAIP